jgi:hypothetical protein
MAESSSTAKTGTNKPVTPAKSVVAPVQSQPAEDTRDAEQRNLATEGDVIGSTAVPGTDVDAQDAAIKEAGSWRGEDHQIDEGNFDNPALRGAGTILPGGGYGPPLPDPQVQRKAADPDYQVK